MDKIEDFVLLAQQGDEQAEEKVFENFKETVNQICRSYFLIDGDVEDLIQEGMIGLYKAIKNFSIVSNASFKTFATLCIKRQIQTAIKHASTQKNKPLSEAINFTSISDNNSSDEEVFLQSNKLSPDDKMIANENFNELKEKIKNALSDMELKILNLYLQGFTYAEISFKLNLNKKSVDNALSRIKNKLSYLK
ncbi:MAG: sigma-70 family RNA polymerase sigma factor [Clostridia bacterium]|nr:sigma-70 family RNA polymerase sigma factor [Clostridia bacterium]